ncbi:hypothetical protein ACFVYA_11775 [Amycolatopsis sp. NPDC058278]|uniref:hypothetical protein n=1 Tax=Amycolatopsis sp. NPDC058278 TaxID=3346417 RepID=UPI0036DA122A
MTTSRWNEERAGRVFSRGRPLEHAYGLEVFLPGERHMSIAFDFVSERPGERRMITWEFAEVEVMRIEPDLPTGVDPGYGHALLFGVAHWVDAATGREGFTVSTTTFEAECYAMELHLKVAHPVEVCPWGQDGPGPSGNTAV